MNPISPADLDQLIKLIDFLLISVGFSAFVFGGFIGSYVRYRYESWKWFKRGIYCDDCAPLVHKSLQDGNQ